MRIIMSYEDVAIRAGACRKEVALINLQVLNRSHGSRTQARIQGFGRRLKDLGLRTKKVKMLGSCASICEAEK